MEILLEILASDASPLFHSLLERGLVNESSFGYEYFEGTGYATVMFSGESKDPQAVADAISAEFQRLSEEGISEEVFEYSKRAVYGEIIAALNSTSSISNALISFSLKGRELFTYIDTLVQLKLEEVQKKLSLFEKEKSVLSVVRPL